MLESLSSAILPRKRLEGKLKGWLAFAGTNEPMAPRTFMKMRNRVWRGKSWFGSFWALSLVSAWIGVANQGFAATVNVNVEDDFFSPSTTNINAGDSVMWTVVGFDGHTITSESHPADWTSTGTNFPPFTFTVNFPNTGTFPYECKVHVLAGMVGSIKVNPATANPPTVSITSPSNSATFTAPASVAIVATAAVTGSTISDVELLIDATSVADVTSAPYQATANNVAAGSHTITAIASAANGLKATNTLNIQVNTASPPPVITIDSTNLVAAPGSFQFSYSADINSGYIVERSTDLINWVAIATNDATANPETFTDTNAPASGAYYKVEFVAP